jgi:hypothetical protein
LSRASPEEWQRMRAFGLMVGIWAGIAGGVAARAADLPPIPANRTVGLYYAPHGVRAGETWIWAWEPGIVVRPYWRAPWRHRHYFPVTGRRPLVGRDEDLDARAEGLDPPETFSRVWTTSSAFVAERPWRRREFVPEPQPEPPLK